MSAPAVSKTQKLPNSKNNREMGSHRPHILVIAFPAQGHVNPLMHFAQRLADHGLFKITFINTDFNHKRVVSGMVGRDVSKDPHIISLASIPDGLGPEDDRNDIGKLCDSVLTVMPTHLEELIQDINNSSLDGDNKISCILADGHMSWARELAERMGIKFAVVWPASAGLYALEANFPRLLENGYFNDDGVPIKKGLIQLSSSMPKIDTENLPWSSIGDPRSQRAVYKFIARTSEESLLTEWQLCNSTYELEPGAFSLVPSLLPIGPLLANYDTSNAGAQFWQEDSTCLEWLDRQPPKSVIYIAFGSITIFDQTQFHELALGLELTKRPFLWVVRQGMTKSGSRNLYPETFQGKLGKIASWVPQQKVLSHPAIACFVSHCGWNSTIEGLYNGVPFLCWPYFADQFLNMGYVCDVWKNGLGLAKDENGIVRKEEFKIGVDQLLGDESIRARSTELKAIVRKNLGKDGQSSTNFNTFVKWLREDK